MRTGTGYVRDTERPFKPVAGRLKAMGAYFERYVDLSPLARVADQGGTQSCTGQAGKVMFDIAQAASYLGLDRVMRERPDQLRLATDALRDAGAVVPASALGLYCNGRLAITRAGQPFADEGAHFRSVFDRAMTVGVVAEEDMPWDEGAARKGPGFDALTQAGTLKADDWATIDEGGQAAEAMIDACLSVAHPVGFAAPVTRDFQGLARAEGAYDGDSSPVAGLHAMVVVGVDDMAGLYLVQNSWGEGWGNNRVVGTGNAGPGCVWVTKRWLLSVSFERTVVYGYVPLRNGGLAGDGGGRLLGVGRRGEGAGERGGVVRGGV